MTTGLRIARIQPPHHWHLDAIRQAFDHGITTLIIGIGSADKSHTPDNPFSVQERHHMLTLLLEQNGLTSQTQIHHISDFPDNKKRIQNIVQTVPEFTHIISDNPRVTDLFNDKIIIQPQNNLPVRASDIRQAIIQQQNHIIEQYLSTDVIGYLKEIDGYKRLLNTK